MCNKIIMKSRKTSFTVVLFGEEVNVLQIAGNYSVLWDDGYIYSSAKPKGAFAFGVRQYRSHLFNLTQHKNYSSLLEQWRAV